MEVREIVGVLVGVLVLAGFSVAIVNGGQTANILTSMGNSFSGVVRSATAGGK